MVAVTGSPPSATAASYLLLAPDGVGLALGGAEQGLQARAAGMGHSHVQDQPAGAGSLRGHRAARVVLDGSGGGAGGVGAGAAQQRAAQAWPAGLARRVARVARNFHARAGQAGLQGGHKGGLPRAAEAGGRRGQDGGEHGGRGQGAICQRRSVGVAIPVSLQRAGSGQRAEVEGGDGGAGCGRWGRLRRRVRPASQDDAPRVGRRVGRAGQTMPVAMRGRMRARCAPGRGRTRPARTQRQRRGR